jgi:glutamate-1-semialdehyde 2,1-aminomutase
MVALSLPVGEADMDRFVNAVSEFAESRRHLIQVGGVTL